MKKRLISLALMLAMLVVLLPAVTLTVGAATAPTGMWVASSETNGIPVQIDVFVSKTTTSGTYNNKTTTYTCMLCLPGNVDPATCFLSWDGDMNATVNTTSYASGACPVPAPGETLTYQFKDSNPKSNYVVTTFQGSANVQPVFIDIDESNGNHTIAEMDNDHDHEITCTGRVYCNGQWYEMPKIKGRGNYTWWKSKDKRPYNITLKDKINFPGIDSAPTKKWSILAEISDHSLMCNRVGFHLAHDLGVGQDTASADVWMNGEYQGCYTVTPKYDSFVTDDGFLIEEDNYQETHSVAEGGNPQFALDGLKGTTGYESCYNYITVKKMGDNLLMKDGVLDESAANQEAVAETIRVWLQDAWDAIRSDTGRNQKGKYYTDYIDIESFAKMYLMHEYVKSFDVCAGSILFHRDGQTPDDKLIAGPIWDLDNAMGSTYQNSSLGKADDRRNGDRRSGAGSFIPNITEYKTSIFKTLSKHTDFMQEVLYQYNKYNAVFSALPDVTNEMKSGIYDSAVMNHNKVNEITDYNIHKYSNATTFERGTEYEQQMLATTNSKTDWPNYASNLNSYVTARSRWFYNQYYDPNNPANCEHAYEAVVTPPTCTTEGFTTYTCPKCGDNYKDNYTPVSAHNYQDGACIVCGQKLLNVSISCSDGASVTVYDTQDINGPCVENATSTHPRNSDTGLIDCSGSGQVNFVVNLEPGYELVSVAAEPATAYKNLKLPADTGITNGYRITKVKGDLTITVTARCVHDYKSVVTEPTCTAKGYTTHTCSYCGDSYVDDYVEALGHAWGEWTVTTPPTCEAKGEETRTCAHDASHLESREIAATGHSWDNGKVTKEATCTEAGEKTYTCEHDSTHTYTETIRPLGHSLIHVQSKAATCEEAGNIEYWRCSACGKLFNDEAGKDVITPEDAVINAIGHKWDVGTITKEATCTEAGMIAFTCERDPAHTRSEEIPPLGHTLTHTEAVAATCETAGSIEYWRCDTCNKLFSDNTCDNVITAEDTVVKATGHKWNAGEITKAATCTEAGSRKKVCVNCGAAVVETIPAKGHTWKSEYTVDQPATCTRAGSESIHCSVCDTVKDGTVRAIPIKGHAWNSNYTIDKIATCTEQGTKSIHCSVCNAVKEGTAQSIPKTAHQYGVWKVTKAATYTAAGSKERVCKHCNYVQTQSIPMLPRTALTADAVTGIVTKTYTGKALTQSIVVTVNGKKLTAGTDYKVAYQNNINAGTATVTITGLGAYSKTVTKTFKISPKKITPTVTLSKTAFVYNGKVQKPTVTVKAGTTKLGTASYTVTWSPTGCKVVGVYKGTVKLKGNYIGSKTVSYKINPKGTTMSKVTAVSKGFTAAWTKQATQTTGYQIQYSLSSTFASGNKTALINKNTTLSKKVTGLTAKKKYYVRVRTYKTVDTTKFYSTWSPSLAVTTKA